MSNGVRDWSHLNVRCEHCRTARRRRPEERGRPGPFYCDEHCERLYEAIGVRMECGCGCGRSFGSRTGFGMFATEQCAISHAPVAAQAMIEAWRNAHGPAAAAPPMAAAS